MKILITGSGSLATELIRQLHDKVSRLVVYSRNENRQHELMADYPEYPDNVMRYFIGDIRDQPRLIQAMTEIDYVIHTAALKQVPQCEYNPEEAIKTNILGSINVAMACHIAGVKRCIISSTDKAVNPINLYGSTKLCAEKYFISANNYGKCRFSVCRYGNVLGSRGSVLKVWEKQYLDSGEITITRSDMTRFWIKLEDAACFIRHKLDIMQGGEIFVPGLSSTRMDKFALQYYPKARIKETGIRGGEKIHESLINEEEARNCYIGNGYYVAFPTYHDWIKEFDKTGLYKSDNNLIISSGGKDG